MRKSSNPFKILIGLILGIAPASLVFYLWYIKLIGYIVSVIPAGPWHDLAGMAVYILLTFVGGGELILSSFLFGFFLAGIFYVGADNL